MELFFIEWGVDSFPCEFAVLRTMTAKGGISIHREGGREGGRRERLHLKKRFPLNRRGGVTPVAVCA